MKTNSKKTGRKSSVVLMSVPGHDDTETATWYAYDRASRKPVASGERGEMMDLVAFEKYRMETK